MAADIRVQGIDDLKAKLLAITPALRKRVLRNALSAGARLVRDQAKKTLKAKFNKGTAKAPYRKSGTVANAIRVRVSKRDGKNGDIGVFVNVKPIRGEKVTYTTGFIQRGKLVFQKRSKYLMAGANNPNDPFYWRWLEFGWNPGGKANRTSAGKRAHRKLSGTKIAGAHFLRDSKVKFPEALKVFEAAVTKWIDKVNTSGKVTP